MVEFIAIVVVVVVVVVAVVGFIAAAARSFDDGAEEQCERSIAAAWAVNPRSLDASQALASLRLSQGRSTDACRAMDR